MRVLEGLGSCKHWRDVRGVGEHFCDMGNIRIHMTFAYREVLALIIIWRRRTADEKGWAVGRGTELVSFLHLMPYFLCRLGRIGEGRAGFDSGVESVNGVLQTSRTFSSIS